ncbi:MAG: hypothetical protein ABJF07_06445, partial [Nisaea sp.]|uniref:hypothetical protein n=1 Tax=Nisaea sp. TaxID=2024842 RepID=UPI00326536F7
WRSGTTSTAISAKTVHQSLHADRAGPVTAPPRATLPGAEWLRALPFRDTPDKPRRRDMQVSTCLSLHAGENLHILGRQHGNEIDGR